MKDDKILDEKPADSAEDLFKRGKKHHDALEYDAAIADYTAALAIKPDDHEALNNRGNAYDDKGDYDKAIADWQEALKLVPDNAELREQLDKMIAEANTKKAAGAV